MSGGRDSSKECHRSLITQVTGGHYCSSPRQVKGEAGHALRGVEGGHGDAPMGMHEDSLCISYYLLSTTATCNAVTHPALQAGKTLSTSALRRVVFANSKRLLDYASTVKTISHVCFWSIPYIIHASHTMHTGAFIHKDLTRKKERRLSRGLLSGNLVCQGNKDSEIDLKIDR